MYVCRYFPDLGCKARPLGRAGLDTPGPAGGREGCLERETVGSSLRGEEIQEGPSYIQERGLWAFGTARVGRVKKPGWSFQVSPEEPELHPMGKRHLGKARSSCYPGLDRDRTQLA